MVRLASIGAVTGPDGNSRELTVTARVWGREAGVCVGKGDRAGMPGLVRL